MNYSQQQKTIYGSNAAAGRYCTTNGVKLYYEVYGSGPPLLLLHGNIQSIAAFEKQILFFEQHYQVIIPDCRGRGKSTDNDAELTFDIQALDMKLLLDHLGLAKADIIGWSDGGIIGLLMAKDYPEKLGRLVACGVNTQQDATAFFEEDLEVYRQAEREQLFCGIEQKLLKLILHHPNIPVEDLGKIQCPVLVVAGDRDSIRIEHTVTIFQALPHGQLLILPQTSHRVLSENPDTFNKAALRFLQEPLSKPQ